MNNQVSKIVMTEQKLKWHTEKRKINQLVPFEGNPRQMTEKQNEDLKKSLEKFNLVEIPAIDTDDKIIAGHQRLRILQMIGRGKEEIDVRVPNRKLTDKEFREYNIRSNKNLGEWDFDILANFDEDLLLDVGFDSEELDKIFGLETEEDEIPDLPKDAKTNLGDIYQLGNHRLMCGDCLKDLQLLLENKKVKLCFTSPPYNMAGGMYEKYKDNLKSEKFIDLHLEAIREVKKYLNGFIFWNVSYNKNARWEFLEILYKITKEKGLRFLELIVWDKGHGLPINSKRALTRRYEDLLLVGDEDSIQKDLELFFIGECGQKSWFNKKNHRGITNYWRITTNNTQLKNLKACFPVALPQRGIELMTSREDNIIDIFGGSGSTLIAAEKTNRNCYIMELDPKYCDVIIKRWEKFTGKKAKKL